MIDLLKETPVETYYIQKIPVLVKREDLCGTNDSPTFSKIRGLVAHLISLKNKGITTIGYTETSISMAGWGVAWACKMLGLKAVIFDPQYKDYGKEHLQVLKYHRSQWKKFDATIINIQAGMAKVNWYISKSMLEDIYGEDESILLPLGLPFQETIDATAEEVIQVLTDHPKIKNIVVNIGSGTIAAGIWKGCINHGGFYNIFGVLGRSSELKKKKEIIAKKAGVLSYGVFQPQSGLSLVDEGWEYTQKCEIESPFPCHPYYDLKAWDWLERNIHRLKEPILFWNIGH